MIKVLSIVGTRPEAIKMAPVIRALRTSGDGVVSKVCSTGQHREMLDPVLDLFKIEPDFDLQIMREGQTPGQVAAEIFRSLEGILKLEKPDWVLVQGDTTTAMAASLVAFYNRVRVGHVEAGLRTRDKWQPFPEEVNRRIVGVVADLHFAPTERSRQNLVAENVPDHAIRITGNTVVDALQWVSARPVPDSVTARLQSLGIALAPTTGVRRVVVTAHRRENHGIGIRNICSAIRTLASDLGPSIQFIYPVHLNPVVQNAAREILENVPNVILIPPLDYLPMVALIKSCHIVLTDSGGLQEEAPSLGKPVLVLRNTTERPEGVDAGTVRLVGTEEEAIVEAVAGLLTDRSEYESMANAVNPYGDGKSAPRIVDAIRAYESRTSSNTAASQMARMST